MGFSVHKVYVSTCKDTDDPPWVEVTTDVSYEKWDAVQEKMAEIEVASVEFVRSLPKWKEAQRFIKDANRQKKALGELAKMKNPSESAIKTAKATLRNLEAQVQEDPDLGITVMRMKSRSRSIETRKTLIKTANYVMSAGGDFEACRVDMSGEPENWLGKLRPVDISNIRLAIGNFNGLTEEEVQDLLTPRRTSSATPRRLPSESETSTDTQVSDGSDSTETTSADGSGVPVA